MGDQAVRVRLRPSGHGQVGPEGLQRDDSGAMASGSHVSLQRFFSFSSERNSSSLGVISHLHLCRDCDRDAEVTSSGVVGIRVPVDGVQCLVSAG